MVEGGQFRRPGMVSQHLHSHWGNADFEFTSILCGISTALDIFLNVERRPALILKKVRPFMFRTFEFL